MSVTLVLACQLCQSAPNFAAPPAAADSSAAPAAAPCASTAARNAAASSVRGCRAAPQAARRLAPRSASVRMVGHPLGHGLHGIETRVERHEQEEQEIDGGEDARQDDVQAFRRLHAEVTER